MQTIKVVNKPVKVSIHGYEEAIAQYQQRVCTLPGVISIYTMGGISAPGLSDIDMIVIVSDEFKSENAYRLATTGIDDRLFIHGPVIFPESLAPYLQYIIYASNLKLLNGFDCLPSFNDLPVADANALGFAYLIDFLESRFLQYAEVFESGSLDQRMWMTRLWSLTHSWKFREQLQLSSDEWARRVIDEIIQLRGDWLNGMSISDDRFKNLFHLSFALTKRFFVEALNEVYYSEEYNISDFGDVRIGSKHFSFGDHQQEPKCDSKSLRLFGRKLRIYFSDYPIQFKYHLASYGFIDDLNRVPTPFHPVLLKRSKLVRLHWNWLDRNCYKSGSMRGYLGAKPRTVHTLKDLGENLAHTILGYFLKHGYSR